MSTTAIESLLEMGFGPKAAVESALAKAKGSIETAIQILSSSGENQPMDVDEDDDASSKSSVLDAASPSSSSSTSSTTTSSTSSTAAVANSYKCNETGKLFRSMADVQMYSEKTGRTDFSETTETIKPRTKEEMAAAQLKIKELIKIKKAERELEEKKHAREAEKKRRTSGKGSGNIKEEMAKKQRALMFAQQKKGKFFSLVLNNLLLLNIIFIRTDIY